MEKLNAFIVDDEVRARRVLSNLLLDNSFDKEVEIVGEASTVSEAVDLINQLRPDLVFLDIQMADHLGYELFDFFEDVFFDVIFVTAYNQYAIKAFELNALDYLTKPVNRNRLISSVNRSIERTQQKFILKNYQDLIQTFENNKTDKMVLNELNSRKVVYFDEILCVEGMGSYSTLHFENGSSLVTSKRLKYFQDLFSDNPTFFRCHKSWIVSIKKIKEFNTTNYTLTLTTQKVIRFSRNQKAELQLLLS